MGAWRQGNAGTYRSYGSTVAASGQNLRKVERVEFHLPRSTDIRRRFTRVSRCTFFS
jgi:hypothetical protein